MPSSWSTLPDTVIIAFLSLLPLRPRLRIASLACRTWRRAALASVTHVDLLLGASPNDDEVAMKHARQALSVLPALRSVYASLEVKNARRPWQLETLTLAPHEKFRLPDENCLCMHWKAVCNLTDLSLQYCKSCTDHMIRRNAPTLRSLHLYFMKPIPQARIIESPLVLAGLHLAIMPRLHSLAITLHNSAVSPDVLSTFVFLLRSHQSQITSLRLLGSCAASLNPLLAIPFPKLRYCRLSVDNSNNFPALSTTLSSVDLTLNGGSVTDLHSLDPRLCTLRIPTSSTVSDSSLSCLTSFNRLTKLSLLGSDHRRPFPQHCPTQLRRLSYALKAGETHHLACTNLSSLTLELPMVALLRDLPAQINFTYPHLRKLKLLTVHSMVGKFDLTVEQYLDMLKKIYNACPQLTTLVLNCFVEGIANRATELAKEAEKHGVHRIGWRISNKPIAATPSQMRQLQISSEWVTFYISRKYELRPAVTP